jgi:ribonuclease R
LRGNKPDTSPAAREALQLSATLSSARERAVMDIEREVVDLYRCLLMREHIGETFEGTVNALVGTGPFISLDAPFVDVLVRYEAMGPDQYQPSDDELSVVGARSGDTIALGDRVLVTVEDVAILRRQTYGRRVPPEALLKQLKDAPEMPRRMQRLSTSHGGPSGKQGDAQRQNIRGGQQGGRPGNRTRPGEQRQDTRQAGGRSQPQRGGKPSGSKPGNSKPGGAKPSGSFPRSDATGRGKPGKQRGGRRK